MPILATIHGIDRPRPGTGSRRRRTEEATRHDTALHASRLKPALIFPSANATEPNGALTVGAHCFAGGAQQLGLCPLCPQHGTEPVEDLDGVVRRFLSPICH